MFITAQLPRQSVQAIAVPEAAVQYMQSGPAVFVAGSEGKFTQRDVTVGERAHDMIVIKKGLTVGETVVVQGAFWVRTQLQRAELEE